MWKVPEEFQLDPPIKQEKLKKSNTNIHLKQPEHIREIGSRRSSKLSQVNCPPITALKQPIIDPHFDAHSVSGESSRGSRK